MLKLLKDLTNEELLAICDRHNKDCRRCQLRSIRKWGISWIVDCKRNGEYIKNSPNELINVEE